MPRYHTSGNQMTRRDWLTLAGLGALIRPRAVVGDEIATDALVQRVAGVIREYEAQGFHRTGTTVDNVSAEWLVAHVRRAGLHASLEPFALDRVDPVTCTLTIGERRIDGLPLFDGGFTSAAGIDGTLGVDIALTETAVNAAARGALGDARRASRYRAIVAITKGRTPGLCPSNADAFLNPFGPPVLQVSSEEGAWLAEQARLGAAVRLVAHVDRVAVTANNVTAEILGTQPALPPLVVMTPRSGWYACSSERGGGIACWLEVMRALAATPARRSVFFVASSGHELGHLGIDAYIARRSGIVGNTIAWVHLGANIGAATDKTTLLQAADDEIDAAATGALKSVGVDVTVRAPRGSVPAGEAEAVHRGGGRYVSFIGGNALFHHVDDVGAAATDPATTAKFAAALTALTRALASAA
jgi:hypothetical protein